MVLDLALVVVPWEGIKGRLDVFEVGFEEGELGTVGLNGVEEPPWEVGILDDPVSVSELEEAFSEETSLAVLLVLVIGDDAGVCIVVGPNDEVPW